MSTVTIKVPDRVLKGPVHGSMSEDPITRLRELTQQSVQESTCPGLGIYCDNRASTAQPCHSFVTARGFRSASGLAPRSHCRLSSAVRDAAPVEGAARLIGHGARTGDQLQAIVQDVRSGNGGILAWSDALRTDRRIILGRLNDLGESVTLERNQPLGNPRQTYRTTEGDDQ